jgi:hypoxanthine phosphoribosyltransferase
MKSIRREILTWQDVDRLVDHLLPQFNVEIDEMILITRGGIIPGGLLAEALNVRRVLTAAVDFPEMGVEMMMPASKTRQRGSDPGMFAWPFFLQFPNENLLADKRILVVDDVWGSGRTIMAVKNRVEGAKGIPYSCVFHFNPSTNRFKNNRPDFYAATTDAYIVYPWEMDRGMDKIPRPEFRG